MPRNWYLIHVKPRTEKKMQAWLTALKIWNYLPVSVNVRKVQRRTVRTEIPIFPSYILARMSDNERVQAMKSNLVVVLIPIDQPRQVIHQLRQVVRAARNSQEHRSVPIEAKTSTLVRIMNGPLTGLEGYVKRVGDKCLVIANMDVLGTAIEVEVSPEDIKGL